MNKLVSKNPVLRFKLGRKIVKAADGLKANKYGELAYFLGGNEKVFKGHIDQSPLNKRLTQRYIFNGKQYGSFDGGKLYYDLSSLKPLNYKSNLVLLNAINRRNNPKFEETIETGRTGVKGTERKNNPPITSGFIKGYLNTDDIQNVVNQYGGIKGFQQFLIDNKFLSGDRSKKEGADGWWGDNTQKAYEAWKASLGSSPEVTNYVASLVPDALKPQQDLSNSGSLPTIQEQMLALTNNYTLTPELKATSLLLDKSGTRNWMKNTLNLSPYKYTGALRAGVRRIAGGLGTEEDKNLILLNPEVYEALKKAGYWRFKQGGNLLPSKNIVERFKQRNFR